MNHDGERRSMMVNDNQMTTINQGDTRWTMMTSLHPSSTCHTAGQRTHRCRFADPALPDSSVVRAMANPLLLQYIHYHTSCQRQLLTHSLRRSNDFFLLHNFVLLWPMTLNSGLKESSCQNASTDHLNGNNNLDTTRTELISHAKIWMPQWTTTDT